MHTYSLRHCIIIISELILPFLDRECSIMYQYQVSMRRIKFYIIARLTIWIIGSQRIGRRG